MPFKSRWGILNDQKFDFSLLRPRIGPAGSLSPLNPFTILLEVLDKAIKQGGKKAYSVERKKQSYLYLQMTYIEKPKELI